MTGAWVYFDEREADRTAYRGMLEGAGLHVESIPPPSTLAVTEAMAGVKDIAGFLVDFALSDAAPEIRYSGTTLATHLRQEYPDRPVVVLSAMLRDARHGAAYARTHFAVDMEIQKVDLAANPDRVVGQLQAIATGYHQIRLERENPGGPEAAALSLLGLHDQVGSLPDDIASLVAWIAAMVGRGAASVGAAIIREILVYPGPVVPVTHGWASSIVGLMPMAFERREGQFSSAEYRGIFGGLFGKSYWTAKLLGLSVADMDIPERARCYICDAPPITVCEVCHELVDGIHSLPAVREEAQFPDCRRARVCGVCIQTPLPRGLVLDARHSHHAVALARDVAGILKRNG